MSDAETEVILAVLPKDSPRAKWWIRMFGGMRVPIDTDVAQMTILPDGENCLCYFVDFDVTGEEFAERLIAMAPSPTIANMVASGLYPIRAADVTTVKGPKSLWTTPKK